MATAPDTHEWTRPKKLSKSITAKYLLLELLQTMINNYYVLSIAINDHFEVCQSLKNLGSPNIHRRLGGALGLLHPTLKKMTSFPDDVVAAWLNRQDEVLQHSGEPTWSTLENALRKIGQTGLAEDVKDKGKGICHAAASHASSGVHTQINSSTQTDSG